MTDSTMERGPFDQPRLNALRKAIITCIERDAAEHGVSAETHERGFAGIADEYFQRVTITWMTVCIDDALRELGYTIALTDTKRT